MAGAIYTIAELNTIITMLGCLCATVQAATGYYTSIYKRKTALLKINPILNHSHRTFGAYSTVLYLLGLFAGSSGFIGALLNMPGSPPLEYANVSFNVHVWASFPIAVIVLSKIILSYTNKKFVYKNGKWFGIATYIAWSYTWITSAISYYLRTLPSNPQHVPPIILLPYGLLWLQLLMPFLLGGIVSTFILIKADKLVKAATKSK